MASRISAFSSLLLILLVLHIQFSAEQTVINETSSNMTGGEDPSPPDPEETSTPPNTTPGTQRAPTMGTSMSNVTGGAPDPEETSTTPNTTPGTQRAPTMETSSNVTGGEDPSPPDPEETSTSPNTTPGTQRAPTMETSMSNMTGGAHPSPPNPEETSTSPNTTPGTQRAPTMETSSNVTGGAPDPEETSTPPNTTPGTQRAPTMARTFPARITFSTLHPPDGATRGSQRSQVTPTSQSLTDLFSGVFGHIEGYLSSSVIGSQVSEGQVTIVHLFSMMSDVTEESLQEELTLYAHRTSLLHTDAYQSLGLCDFSLCDSASSDCWSRAGLVTCECRPGYYKFSDGDRTCTACQSGFWWSEGRCQRCPLGYGGFNCQEVFLLVLMVESCVVVVLFGSLVSLLYYHLRRKKKPNPTIMDGLVWGAPCDQPALRLPRAQFSWRREWEWAEPPGKSPQPIHGDRGSEAPEIHLRSFGSFRRASASGQNRGSHNLSFISDD